MKKKLLFILLVGVCLLTSCRTTLCYDDMSYDKYYQDYYYHHKYGVVIKRPYYRVYPRYYKIYPRHSNRPNNQRSPRILYPDPKPSNRRSSQPAYHNPKPSRPSPQAKVDKHSNKPRSANTSDRKRSSAAGSPR